MTNSHLCSHCQLPLREFVQRREVNGDDHAFCCYGCCLAFLVKHGSREEPVAAWLLIRLGVATFLAMNIMLFSLMLYSGSVSTLSDSLLQAIHVLLWMFATPVVFFVGGPFMLGAWQAMKRKRVTADSLVALGTLGAYFYSVYQVLSHGKVVYFDTATMVIVLFTVGRYLEAIARVRTTRSLMPMLEAERASATVVNNDKEIQQAVIEISPGSVVRVKPGERVPIDGEVIEGQSNCSEEVLTGQKEDITKQVGSCVYAGSINKNGQLLIRATTSGKNTHWMRISKQIRKTLAHKTLVGEVVDRIAAVFIVAVLILAACTISYWSGQTSFEKGLLAGLAVLIVACPCALGLAAPLATTLGLGQAAQRGIMIRDGGVFEHLARIKGIAFDKTGTLTPGSLQVKNFLATPNEKQIVIQRAAILAAGSSHPKAQAIAQTLHQYRTSSDPYTEFKEHPGQGVSANFDGTVVSMGSLDFMYSMGCKFSQPTFDNDISNISSKVYIGWQGLVHGFFGLIDSVEPEVQPMVKALHNNGLSTCLLSGDLPSAVEVAAKQAGIEEWKAGLMPWDKVNVINEWTQQIGPVAMVGDGINDGPVLAAAKVGIAVGNATDLARASADITLPEQAMGHLPWLIAHAKNVQKTVVTNLIWAFSYNAIALTLAATGLLQPVIAAALMAGSSLVVVINSLASGKEIKEPSTLGQDNQVVVEATNMFAPKKV